MLQQWHPSCSLLYNIVGCYPGFESDIVILFPQGDDAVEFAVNVRILGDEKRFGFSVMGGVDEGFPPRIDEISPGIMLIINK